MINLLFERFWPLYVVMHIAFASYGVFFVSSVQFIGFFEMLGGIHFKVTGKRLPGKATADKMTAKPSAKKLYSIFALARLNIKIEHRKVLIFCGTFSGF